MRCEVDNSPLENSETKLSSFKPVVGLRPNSSENGRGMISKNGNCHFFGSEAPVEVGGVIDNRGCGCVPLILELELCN
jgi:hypothetical protein